ncbi:MAG: ABC transporter substrate-binding protein [Chloroflexota bacterium]|nr:ABC transporter substrate-binding protein [Chloroflexota bacterium]
MRIASLVSAGTEICFALGLGRDVVGVSHECDFPPEVAVLPRLTSSLVDPSISSREIDAAVTGVIARGGGNADLYHVDADTLARVRPDVLVTQRLCEVCAISVGAVERALAREHSIRVVTMTGGDLEGVWADIRLIGEACGAERAADDLLRALEARHVAVRRAVDGRARPTVGCLEWLDPPFDAGHWVPEQIAAAGGVDLLARPRHDSRRRTWDEIRAADPDVLLLMPCGFGIERAAREAHAVRRELASLRAAREGRAWIVDGNAYFSRPGPRLVDGIELVAALLHPGSVPLPVGGSLPLALDMLA